MRDFTLHQALHQGLFHNENSSFLFPEKDFTKTCLGAALLITFAFSLLKPVNQSLAYSQLKAKERELLGYIALRTGQPVHHISPDYEFWTPEEINRAYYGESYENQSDVIALAKDGDIILAQGYDVEAEPEVLLHELYHVVVTENDIRHRCRAEEERAAYDLQIEYVDEIGFGRKPSPLFLLFLNCDMAAY
jgi:hypothetical protein